MVKVKCNKHYVYPWLNHTDTTKWKPGDVVLFPTTEQAKSFVTYHNGRGGDFTVQDEKKT